MKRKPVVLGLVLAAILGLAVMPATTRQGVDFHVTSHRLPAYVKLFDFFVRDAEYCQLASEVTRNLPSEAARIQALYDWTRHAIRPTPPGWPVVDDHIQHIIIRGYGTDDQMADVFTTLATYAGLPAYWSVIERPGSGEQLILSFARASSRWAVFDVANGIQFTNSSGAWATPEELAAHPELIRKSAGALVVRGIPYEQFFLGFTPPVVPHPLRAELQMPGPRLAASIQRVFTRESAHGP